MVSSLHWRESRVILKKESERCGIYYAAENRDIDCYMCRKAHNKNIMIRYVANSKTKERTKERDCEAIRDGEK